MTPRPVTLAELRTIDLFDDLDDAGLQPWVAAARPLHAEPGDAVTEQGEDPPGLILLLEGDMRSLLQEGESIEQIGRQEAPTWIGAIAVLTRGPSRCGWRPRRRAGSGSSRRRSSAGSRSRSPTCTSA